MADGHHHPSDLTLSSFHRRLFKFVNSAPDGRMAKSVRFRHRLKDGIGYISSLSASPDGLLLAIASKGLAIVFDVVKESEILRYQVTSGKATSVNLCMTGKMLAVGDTGGGAVVYDLNLNKVVRIYSHDCCVNHVHLSEEGDLLALASGTKAIVYSNATGRVVREIICDASISSVCLNFRSDNIFLEMSSCVELFSVRTGAQKGRFGDSGETNTSQFAPAEYLLFKSIGRNAFAWNVTTGEMLRRFKHPSHVTALAFKNCPGQSFITACKDGNVQIFGAAAGEQPLMILRHSDEVQCIDTTDDGRWVFSGGDAARLWDREAGLCLKTFKGDVSPVIATCLTKDERRILIGGADGVLKMYDLGTGHPVQRFEGHSGWISAIALCEDLKVAATAGHDNTACVFSLSGDLIHRLKGHDDFLHAIAISRDKRLVATGGRDNSIILWELGSGKSKFSWKAHRGWVRSLAFSRDGKYLLSAGNDGMARLWETASDSLIMECGFHSDIVYSAVLSPDERFIVTAGNDSILKIFTLDGSKKWEFSGHVGGVRNLFFHRDGTLISVGLDCTARRWDPQTGKCLMTYRDLHSDWIRTASVTADDILILGSKDGTLSFSDLGTGKRLATLYNLDRGFLWTCPAGDNADSGWFWTDREELIEVMEVDRNENSVLPATDSRGRKDHISFYNSMTRVMSRIRNKGGDHIQFERLAAMHKECLEKERHSGLLLCPVLHQE